METKLINLSKVKDPLQQEVTVQGFVKGNCKGFKYSLLYIHSVMISEKEGSLSLHIANVKQKSGKTVQDLLYTCYIKEPVKF